MPTQRSSMRSNTDVPDRRPVREEGDLVVVEAPTAEEALDRLTQFLGPDVDIIAAEKVARGGIAGFFAREMVQLTAQPPAAQPPARLPAETPTPATPPAVPAHLARLLAKRSETDATPASPPAPEPTFAQVLRQQLGLPHPSAPGGAAVQEQVPAPAGQLGAEVARTALALVPEIPPVPEVPAALPEVPAAQSAPVLVVPPAPEPPVIADAAALEHPQAPPGAPPPAPADHPSPPRPRLVVTGAVPGTGPVAWSPDELVRLGLPFAFIRPVMDLDPADDLAWIRTLAEAAEPLCAPLPEGDFLLRGHGAEHIAAALGVPVLHRSRAVEGSICVAGVEAEAAQRLVLRLQGERWIHLVVGGGGHVAGDPPPSAVSWVGRTRLPEVLHLSLDLGIPVGYFKSSGRGGGVLRATPVEIALALRDLVVRQ